MGSGLNPVDEHPLASAQLEEQAANLEICVWAFWLPGIDVATKTIKSDVFSTSRLTAWSRR